MQPNQHFKNYLPYIVSLPNIEDSYIFSACVCNTGNANPLKNSMFLAFDSVILLPFYSFFFFISLNRSFQVLIQSVTSLNLTYQALTHMKSWFKHNYREQTSWYFII